MYCIINFICVSKYTINSHKFYDINKLIYRAGVHPDRPPRVEPKITAMLLQDIIKSHHHNEQKGTWDYKHSSDITMLIEHADTQSVTLCNGPSPRIRRWG